jgi:hypothetical protein
LLPSHSPREDDLEPLPSFFEQARNLLGWVLEIAVHYHGPAPSTLGETGGDSGMLPEVPAQPDEPQTVVVGCEPEQQVPRPVRASIIDEDHLERFRDRLKYRHQPFVERDQALRAPIHRDDNAELDCLRTTCRGGSADLRTRHCEPGDPQVDSNTAPSISPS